MVDPLLRRREISPRVQQSGTSYYPIHLGTIREHTYNTIERGDFDNYCVLVSNLLSLSSPPLSGCMLASAIISCPALTHCTML